jgi:hypothetical protein
MIQLVQIGEMNPIKTETVGVIIDSKNEKSLDRAFWQLILERQLCWLCVPKNQPVGSSTQSAAKG